MGSNPIEVLNCIINCIHSCDDHSLFEEKLLVNTIIYFNINKKNRLIIAGYNPKKRVMQLKAELVFLLYFNLRPQMKVQNTNLISP